MLSSIRGGAAAAGAVPALGRASRGLSGPAPAVDAPAIPGKLSRGVTVDISQAGLEAARRRAAVPTVGQVRALGTTSDVPIVRPRLLNLDSSRSLPKQGPLIGNAIVAEGTEANRKPSLSTSIGKGAAPLGRWSDNRSYESLKYMRPGADIERDGARLRSADSLSARLQRGAIPLGQWNSGEYSRTVKSVPGRDIRVQGEQARTSTTLSARIGKGEESLEVTPSRHIVRPDGNGSAS